MAEIRWYKGKYLVEVLEKSNRNWLVQALSLVRVGNKEQGYRWIEPPEKFTTVCRLLYRNPRTT